jgi:hypothetical protein
VLPVLLKSHLKYWNKIIINIHLTLLPVSLSVCIFTLIELLRDCSHVGSGILFYFVRPFMLNAQKMDIGRVGFALVSSSH